MGVTAMNLGKMDRLRYRIGQLDGLSKLGFCLLLACLLIALTYAWPQTRALQQLQLDVADMHHAMPQHQGQWIDRSPQASLNTFYQFLPREHEASTLLNQVLDIAEQHGLVPEKVDYALSRQPTALFSKYQLSLPVRGRYLDIRHFIAEVMDTLPSAALNDIALKREDMLSDQVEAKLRLTLYLRKDGQ